MKVSAYLLSLLCVTSISRAQDTEIRRDYITGTLSSSAFKSRKFAPVSDVRSLQTESNLSASQQKITASAEQAFESDAYALGMIMLDHGKIIFEKYKYGTDPDTRFFSYSMSKSLTAMVVGRALCAGDFTSLEDTAGKYAQTIRDTAFDQATIRQLLTMSGGARTPDQDTGSLNGEWPEITRGWSAVDDILKKYGNERPNIDQFSYNNSQTNALMLAVNGVTNFGDLFERQIWQKAGPEKSSTWLMDKKGQLYAAAGFGATLHDWARLALFSIELRKGSEGKCLADYMMQATSKQISDKIKKRISDYGYQTWTRVIEGKQTYSWQGAYGQTVLVSPENERIMIIFKHKAAEEGYRTIARLFYRWVQMP
jgi:CubicO group peptidase (beta-lactamase class C family)